MNIQYVSGRISATWLIVLVAVAAAVGMWVGGRTLQHPAAPQLQAAVLYPAPRALPEFELTQANGQPLTLADWKGHWTLAFFGFTNCPDVCPTTLAAFKQAWAQLDAAGRQDQVRIDFISVDPERDTPEHLARYVAFFSPDFGAATGSDEQLTRLTRALGLLYARDEAVDGNYSVDHSASAVLIDPDGRQAGLFRPPFDAAKIGADLIALTGGNR